MNTASITRRHYGYGWQVVARIDGARYEATGVCDSRTAAMLAVETACARLSLEVTPMSVPPPPSRLDAAFAAIRRGERRAACLDVGDRPVGAPTVVLVTT